MINSKQANELLDNSISSKLEIRKEVIDKIEFLIMEQCSLTKSKIIIELSFLNDLEISFIKKLGYMVLVCVQDNIRRLTIMW